MPFLPTRNPGVESAWIANSAVIVENAVPIRIARPSRARAPARLSEQRGERGQRGGAADQAEVLVGRQLRRAASPISATSTIGARARVKAKAATILARDMVSGESAAASRT